METTHNTTKTGTQSQVRSLLTVIGIVTAIIGSLVFLHDFRAGERTGSSVPRPIAISKIVNTDVLVQATTTILSIK